MISGRRNDVFSTKRQDHLEGLFTGAGIVVTPGCPASLIQDLLDADVMPVQKNMMVLLPPGFLLEDDTRIDRHRSYGRARILSSPARSFFSTHHLNWVQEKLQSSESIAVLIARPPYRDPIIALASLLVLIVSGKTVTLMRPDDEATDENPESGSDLDGDDITSKWISKKLNLNLLAKELGNLAWFSYPDFVKRLINLADRELNYYFDTYGTDPANLRPLDSSPEAIKRDVAYALQTASLWIDCLPSGVEFIKGKRILEIGPGINFGSIVTLACHGARVLVADRFSSPWDAEYHPKFYNSLRDALAEKSTLIDLTPLDEIIGQEQYPQDIISIYTCSLEELSVVPDQSLNMVISNAVFEHLYDVKLAFAHLARITMPGGLGLHQVDFRDHRDYSRPLEHLLLSDKEFSREFKERHGECGNRLRPCEFQQYFEAAGFEVKEFRSDMIVDEEYLTDFMGRLRQARKSGYRNYNAEDFREASGLFIVVRKPG